MDMLTAPIYKKNNFQKFHKWKINVNGRTDRIWYCHYFTLARLQQWTHRYCIILKNYTQNTS